MSEAELLRAQIDKLTNDIQSYWANTGVHIPVEQLDIQDQVGGGGYSIVYRGLWKGTQVAIKKWFDPSNTDRLMQEFREEVMTMQQLRHPHIVQFLGACMRAPDLVMVTELLPHSLHSILHQQSVEMDRKRQLALAADVCRAFVYLHSRKPAVIHKDLKPANLLVDRAWRVKLCDFGLASAGSQQACAGTPAYMAPELLNARPYNEKVDVYAFGVLMNELITREVPFGGQSPAGIKQQVLAGHRPALALSCPKALAELVRQCWQQEAALRPSFEEVLQLLQELRRQL